MNRNDALAVLTLVQESFLVNDFHHGMPDSMRVKFLRDVREIEGKRGTGKCFCRVSPEYLQQRAEKLQCTLLALDMNLIIDHRCPEHGEKAQPALWGRHTDKELVVTASQWLSLGVVHEVTP